MPPKAKKPREGANRASTSQSTMAGRSQSDTESDGEVDVNDVERVDVDAGMQGISVDYDQDPAERRRLRHKFRELQEQTEELQLDVNNPSTNMALQEQIAKANSLYRQVKHPREATLDSALLVKFSGIVRKKAHNLQTDTLVFKPAEFSEKLITYLRNELDEQGGRTNIVSTEAWRSLGEAAQYFFKRSPPLRILNGLLDQPEREKRVKKAPAAESKDSNSADKRTDPTTIRNAAEMEQHESTTEEVDRVYAILCECYETWGRRPIDYFEFVINPQSFGQTIENIFYTSFLAKDGHIKLKLDEDELPVIEPVYQNEEEREARRKEPRQQMVMSLSHKKWKEIVVAYQIESPLIPTRARRTDGMEGTPMSSS